MSEALLLSIARCPELPGARTDAAHPCHAVACAQPGQLWQTPEPWRGDLAAAPLLFVSSNPSIDQADACPWNDATDAELIRFYGKPAISDAFPSEARFYSGVQARARELFGRDDLRHGVDFALTEVVHCKSRGEAGVAAALPVCAGRHLQRVIDASGARVIVALGTVAAAALSSVTTGARVVRLPHPNARQVRTAAAHLSAEAIAELRAILAGA